MNYKGYHHLKWEDRLKIEGALKTGGKPAEIAEMLGVCVKTIYNEIKRGLCLQQKEGYIFQEEYCAEVAERKYQEHLRAKGPEIKLGRDHAFANFVERKIIEEHYSPGAALAYIEAAGLEFETHICETTLYSYIYRGDVFLELTEEHLLYKGERRRDYEQRERAKEAPGDTIEDRPPEVRARNTFGHWEMDSIMGPVVFHALEAVKEGEKGRSTTVERTQYITRQKFFWIFCNLSLTFSEADITIRLHKVKRPSVT